MKTVSLIEEKDGFLLIKAQGIELTFQELENIKAKTNEAIRKSTHSSLLIAILLIDNLAMGCALSHFLISTCALDAIAVPNTSKTKATIVAKNIHDRDYLPLGSTVSINHLF